MRNPSLFAFLILAFAGAAAASAARLPSDPLLEGLAEDDSAAVAAVADVEGEDSAARSVSPDDGNAERLILRGGYAKSGNDKKYAATVEYSFPVAEEFDASLRLFGLFGQDHETESTAYYRRGRVSYHEHVYCRRRSALGGSAFALWRPCRGSRLEPYLGAGAGFATVRPDTGEDRSNENSFDVALRAGVSFRLSDRIVLTGEGILQGDVSELVADAGFRISDGTRLHMFAEFFDVDLTDGTVFGAGVTFAF